MNRRTALSVIASIAGVISSNAGGYASDENLAEIRWPKKPCREPELPAQDQEGEGTVISTSCLNDTDYSAPATFDLRLHRFGEFKITFNGETKSISPKDLFDAL